MMNGFSCFWWQCGVRSDLKAGAERYKLFSCNFVLLSNMHISTIQALDNQKGDTSFALIELRVTLMRLEHLPQLSNPPLKFSFICTVVLAPQTQARQQVSTLIIWLATNQQYSGWGIPGGGLGIFKAQRVMIFFCSRQWLLGRLQCTWLGLTILHSQLLNFNNRSKGNILMALTATAFTKELVCNSTRISLLEACSSWAMVVYCEICLWMILLRLMESLCDLLNDLLQDQLMQPRRRLGQKGLSLLAPRNCFFVFTFLLLGLRSMHTLYNTGLGYSYGYGWDYNYGNVYFSSRKEIRLELSAIVSSSIYWLSMYAVLSQFYRDYSCDAYSYGWSVSAYLLCEGIVVGSIETVCTGVYAVVQSFPMFVWGNYCCGF